MRCGIMYEQGDILVVPFPFSDLSGIKQRPVLVLSNNKDNMHSKDLITCGITSNIKDASHSIMISKLELEQGQLPKESRIKVNKLFTINKNIVHKKIAKVNYHTLICVKQEFLQLI